MATTTKPEWLTQLLSRRESYLPVLYTAPENMRLADKHDHILEPVLVSIGPFHHNKFPAMKEHKTRTLNSMMDRHKNNNPVIKERRTRILNSMMDKNKNQAEFQVELADAARREEEFATQFLMELAGALREEEAFARGWYSKSFLDIDFVEMMVFDGCFLLEIFRMHAGLYRKDGDAPFFMARWMLPALALDIVKLENQLPYFVLNVLYEKTKLPAEPTLKDLAGSFLALLSPELNKRMVNDDRFQDHLLSLFHSTFVPNANQTDHAVFEIEDEADCLISPPPVNGQIVPGVKDEENNHNSLPSTTDQVASRIKDEGNFHDPVSSATDHVVSKIKNEGNYHKSLSSTTDQVVSKIKDEGNCHISLPSRTDHVVSRNKDEGNCHSSFPVVTDQAVSKTKEEGICLNSFSSESDQAASEINDEENCLNSFPSVTDLRLSGIKVVKKEQWENLLEIKYNNEKLEIPTLIIDHNTKILMRNLIAYEQCDERVQDVFTSYVTFIDALVNSTEDVEVLHKAGVINHFMNSNEEVSILLNNLTANIKFNMNKGYLAGLNKQIYDDHHRASRQFRARFWRLVNSREGIVYIVTLFGGYLAILQTVFTVLSYVLPK